MTEFDLKYDKLKSWFSGKRAAIAFSGGVDSTLVAFAAKDALGSGAAAFTAKTLFTSGSEIDEAKAIAKLIGISHFVMDVKLQETVLDNPPNRCYLCKLQIMRAIAESGKKGGFEVVIDGTNADDLDEERPGSMALKELGVRSPLAELGIGKQAVRGILKLKMEGGIYDKTSNTCAATRFPTGDRITAEGINIVNEAEEHLKGLGFRRVRVRVHGRLARIELNPLEIDKMLDANVRSDANKKLKQLGFEWITLDMEGYRMGNMQEPFCSKKKRKL